MKTVPSLLLGLASLLPGCGGSSGSTSSPGSSTPCTQTVVLQDSATGLGSFQVAYLEFVTATTGRLDVTVDWTIAASPIAVYVVRGECTLDQLNARTCDFVIRQEAMNVPKPHVFSAADVAAGTFDLILGSIGDEDESLSAQVVVSSPSCPAPAGVGRAPRAPAAKAGATKPWLSR